MKTINQMNFRPNMATTYTVATIKKSFELFGHKWCVVEYDSTYQNGRETIATKSKSIAHFTTGSNIQLFDKHNKTLQGYIDAGMQNITKIYKRVGEVDFFKTINNQPIIN